MKVSLSLREGWFKRYFIAVLVVGVELAIKLFFSRLGVTTRFPFIFNELFTVITLALAGPGPAMFSVLLSSVSTLYFFMEPYNALLYAGSRDVYGLVFAILEAALIVVLATPLLESSGLAYWRKRALQGITSERQGVNWVPYVTIVLLVALGLLSPAILLNRILAQYQSASTWIGRTIEVRSRFRGVSTNVKSIEFDASELARTGSGVKKALLVAQVRALPDQVSQIYPWLNDDIEELNLAKNLEHKAREIERVVLDSLSRQRIPSVDDVHRLGQEIALLTQTLLNRETSALHRRQADAEVSIERAALIGAMVTAVSTFLVMVILAVLFFDSRRRSILENELREARLNAEAANNAKTEFLANVSHEIRTPLNGIVGLMDLLKTTRLDTKQRGYVSGVKKSTVTLISLINDILDFSKIEAGMMTLEDVDFELRELVSDVRDSYLGLFDAKHLKLSVSALYPRETRFHADPGRLRQILNNLLSNALKFTEQGAVTLHVGVVVTDKDNAEIHFSVSDTGIGMSDDIQSKVFQAFSQADASTARRFGGTGLGLAISKNLVELMGGTITMRSIQGQGSTFEFTVPVKVADATPVNEVTASETGNFRMSMDQRSQFCVLIAEDNEINQEITRSILDSGGYRTQVASNGREAVQAVRAGTVDGILMDCHMPEMDGYEATRLIREMKIAVPIIALTAKALKEDQQNCFAVGMNGYLSKPVSANLILDTLDKFLGDPLKLRGNRMIEADEPIIDHTAIQRLAEIDTGGRLVQKLIGMYLGSVDGVVQELQDHIERGDKASARLRAHTLKSSSANLGGMRMARLLGEIEEGEINDPKVIVSQLKLETESFCQELERCCLKESNHSG